MIRSGKTPRTWLSKRNVHVGRSRCRKDDFTSSGTPSTYFWNSCARSIGVPTRIMALPSRCIRAVPPVLPCLMQWGELLSARYKGLLRRYVLCGGFKETILALSAHGDAVDLITLDSNQYVSMFLFGRDGGRLIGAFYIVQGPDAIHS